MAAVFDRPVRDVLVRTGTQTNCAGVAQILADLEPAEDFEFVNADDRRWTGRSEEDLINSCVAAVRRGVETALAGGKRGELPGLRFVLRGIRVHAVDSGERLNEAVGQMAVAEALRRLTKTP